MSNSIQRRLACAPPGSQPYLGSIVSIVITRRSRTLKSQDISGPLGRPFDRWWRSLASDSSGWVRHACGRAPGCVTQPRLRCRYGRFAARLSQQADLVANIRAEIEVKGELQFADHDDGRAAVHDADEVATADFSLHMKAEAFQEPLDRRIEASFHCGVMEKKTGCA